MEKAIMSKIISKNIVTLAMFIFFIFPIIAKGETVSIGSDRFSIPKPKGYCTLNSSNASDNRLVTYLKDVNKGMNKVILVFADCAQLKYWRSSKLPNLDDYGYVLVPTSLVDKKLNMNTTNYLSQMSEIFKAQGAEILDRSIDKVEVVLEKHLPLVKLNETKNLGIISKDNFALYLGLLQHIQTEEGKSKNMLGIYGTTLIKGKGINFYLWKKYQGNRTIHDLEVLVSSWVEKTHGSN